MHDLHLAAGEQTETAAAIREIIKVKGIKGSALIAVCADISADAIVALTEDMQANPDVSGLMNHVHAVTDHIQAFSLTVAEIVSNRAAKQIGDKFIKTKKDQSDAVKI